MGSKIFLFTSVIAIFISFTWIPAIASTKNTEVCKTCEYANQGCNTNAETTSLPLGAKAVILTGLIGLATFYFWKQYKKKLYLILGVLIGLAIPASFLYSSFKSLKSYEAITVCKLETDSFTSNSKEEFKPVTDEFKSVSNEEFGSQDTINSDEFAPVSSEFTQEKSIDSPQPTVNNSEKNLLYQILVIFLFIILIGITIKYEFTRKMRPFILLTSVVYLGFINGGCPCMIMSLQNTVLFTLGSDVSLVSMLWFLGLIPLTYFFGKIWCGWLCHLGGLQDYLFKVTGWNFLTSKKSQRILKRIQITLFVILIAQLIITQSNLYVKYDPFKVAFNLISANATGYVLVILLLLSSVLIYRPFCRMACPVGLILGWIALLPRARKLSVAQPLCNGCRSCSRHCKPYALQGSSSPISVNVEDCILCGNCIDHCNKKSLSVSCKK